MERTSTVFVNTIEAMGDSVQLDSSHGSSRESPMSSPNSVQVKQLLHESKQTIARKALGYAPFLADTMRDLEV